MNTLLRFFTAGAVDDGKSTLVGRLLYDAKVVYQDHLQSVRDSKDGSFQFAHLTDGLKAEREQGITIDVAYRYFSLAGRDFILADSPGHEQYTRNMATAASNSQVALILIDAQKGITRQTRRHTFVSSLFGVRRFIVVVNKMDLVNWSEETFTKIQHSFENLSAKLKVREIQFVPISALQGDNVVTSSVKMSWYHGPTVLSFLQSVYVGSDRNRVDFRFPVQYVIKSDAEKSGREKILRGFAGQVLSGSIRVGEEVMVLPSKKITQIKSIEMFNKKISEAIAPQSIAITLNDEIDISRGDMIVRPDNRPHSIQKFEAMLLWMVDTPMDLQKNYAIHHTSKWETAKVESLNYQVDMDSFHRASVKSLTLNQMGRVSLRTMRPIFWDAFDKNEKTGCFILVDPLTHETVAAGTIIDRVPSEEVSSESHPKTLWLTGLSGSGKTTIANAVVAELRTRGFQATSLDGDQIRSGLNKDLGFSKEDRAENIRRIAEMAKLLNNSGQFAVCSLISPLAADRLKARTIIGDKDFVEIFVDTPLEICEARDPKGLYKKARRGEIPEFTGISAPYEAPNNPDILISANKTSVQDAVDQILKKII